MALNEITYNLELNSKSNSDGKYGLLLRITKNRKHRRVSLGLSIKKTHWKKHKNQRRYYLSKSTPDYKTIQDRIKDIKEKAEEFLKESDTQSITFVKKALKGQDRKSFLNFAEKKLKQYENTKSVNYARHVQSFLKNFKKYLNNNDLMFDEITVAFLKEYESYLYSLGNVKNTVGNKLKIIKSIYNEAIDEKIIPQERSPFFQFKISKEKNSKKDKLTTEEIKNIINLDLIQNSLIWHVRNIFLFSFYCAGIRASDCIQLKWENIQSTRLVYQMGKNKKWQNIKLPQPANAIINYYEDTGSENYIFPFLDNNKDYSDKGFLHDQLSSKNALINKYLRFIGQKIETSKNISFHTSRHSFANIAKEKLSIYELKEVLNHSSIKETETYIASLSDEAKDNSLSKVFNE